MEPQDFAVVHFEGMLRLAQALKALPALVLEHQYSGQSFGSWSVVLKHNGKVARITFDGKDEYLSVAYASERKPPYRFSSEHEIELIGGIQQIDDAAIEQITRNIVQGIAAGTA